MLNIAEGSGKYSYKEKSHFYLIARGSTHESAALITLLVHHEIIALAQAVLWKDDLVIISKMLSGMIKKLRQKSTENN